MRILRFEGLRPGILNLLLGVFPRQFVYGFKAYCTRAGLCKLEFGDDVISEIRRADWEEYWGWDGAVMKHVPANNGISPSIYLRSDGCIIFSYKDVDAEVYVLTPEPVYREKLREIVRLLA
jgi:hypothetical protein